MEKEVRSLTRTSGIPLQYVPKEKLKSLASNAQHQGLIGQLSIIQYMNIDDVLSFVYEKGEDPLFLVLDGVEDVRNLGALARSAVWFGFHAIILSIKKSARINSFTYKASAGAIKDIPICRVSSLTKTTQLLKDSGLAVLASESGHDHGKVYDNNSYSEPLALIMGSEGKGISRELRALADRFIAIPGTRQVESLNVSVAGAIMMYEIHKQRITNKD